MAAYFPVMMDTAPLMWLEGLPTNSIDSWAELYQVFTDNYQATYA